MGLFDGLFKKQDHEIPEGMNPLLGMKVREFAVVDGDPVYVKHYFNFRNKKGEDEEFITFYRREGSELKYVSTLSRRVAWGMGFQTLSDRGPWSMAIAYLIEQGHQLSANALPTQDHFASKIGPRIGPKSTKNKAQRSGWPNSAGSASHQEMHGVVPSVEAGEWQIRRTNSRAAGSKRAAEISRTYRFSDSPDAETGATFKIACALQCLTGNGRDCATIEDSLQFLVRPFYLSDGGSFVMRLATADRSQGGVFYVLASPTDGDRGTALISIRRREDAKNCIKIIRSGENLTFVLADQKEILTDLYLPNDPRFSLLYDDASKSLGDYAKSVTD